MKVDPIGALDAHIRRFNEAVRSGDFAEMVEHVGKGARLYNVLPAAQAYLASQQLAQQLDG